MFSKIDKLGLGTVQWGINYGISNLSGITSKNEVKKILNKARSENIKLIDTASQYGDAEEVLGLNNLKEFKVITKTNKFSKNTILKSDQELFKLNFLKSLEKLSINSAYGLLIHNVDDLFKEGGINIIKCLKSLQEKRLVEKIGVSIYNTYQIKKTLEIFKPDIIQLPINVFDNRLIRNGTLRYLSDKDIEIHARSIFLQGLCFIETNKLNKYFKPWENLLNEWHKQCKLNKVTPLTAALNFVLSLPEINYCILGVNNLKQFEDILEATNKSIILEKDFSILDENLINPTNWELR